MKNTKIRILNIELQNLTTEELLDRIDSGVLVTPNLDHLVKLQHDREFYDIYNKAEWVVCDSRVLQLISHISRRPIREAIPGSSFFTRFYMHNRNNPECRIFLLGAAEGVARKAMERINATVGRKIIVGAHSPSFGFERNEEECRHIVDILNASGANVVLVGVGAPKQEKWIDRWKNCVPGVRLWMALGATIDFEAGNIRRAPRIWQRFGMEWLYRFFCEPRRLFKRYFIDDTRFFYYYLRQITGTYRNPFE
ncbi:MAG: WecB/TagA/CpsF family glycosyltransferase, partial [Muribaculaceae bacterium]|nr:WecB/TagA/CpsF family glycosyltransferase [Muribaculaceae bacterium]